MTFISSDQIYRSMALENSPEERADIFQRELVEPLAPLLSASRVWLPNAGTDAEVAAAMGWLGPDDLTKLPEGFEHLVDASAWTSAEACLRSAIDRFLPFAETVAVETDIVGTIVLTRATPASQYGDGYAGGQTPGAVVVSYDKPTPSNATMAGGAIAHEFNHRIRLTAYPWHDPNSVDVAEYVVMEGLAEAFAVEIAGPGALGFYVTSVEGDDLAHAASLIAKNRSVTGFGPIRAHIFGDRIARSMGFDEGLGMPDFGGYAVGYHIVRAFLDRSGTSIEEATLIPAHEIIDGSGFLDA